MNYYYAYHGPKNENDFDWKIGYGVSNKGKRDRVPVGSKVIVIQKTKNASEFRLCGVFVVTKHYDDEENSFPYRLELDNESKLTEYIALDDVELGAKLPQISGGNKDWSNFQKHFCTQGITFQKPLQPEVVQILLSYLNVQDDSYGDDLDNFRKKVAESARLPQSVRKRRLENANPKPNQKSVTTVVYERNPDVVAEVLFNAKGRCEKCLNTAPFFRKSDGSPYLEVHHKIRLSDGGDDSVENAIALCPNCHREEHYG